MTGGESASNRYRGLGLLLLLASRSTPAPNASLNVGADNAWAHLGLAASSACEFLLFLICALVPFLKSPLQCTEPMISALLALTAESPQHLDLVIERIADSRPMCGQDRQSKTHRAVSGGSTEQAADSRAEADSAGGLVVG